MSETRETYITVRDENGDYRWEIDVTGKSDAYIANLALTVQETLAFGFRAHVEYA